METTKFFKYISILFISFLIALQAQAQRAKNLSVLITYGIQPAVNVNVFVLPIEQTYTTDTNGNFIVKFYYSEQYDELIFRIQTDSTFFEVKRMIPHHSNLIRIDLAQEPQAKIILIDDEKNRVIDQYVQIIIDGQPVVSKNGVITNFPRSVYTSSKFPIHISSNYYRPVETIVQTSELIRPKYILVPQRKLCIKAIDQKTNKEITDFHIIAILGTDNKKPLRNCLPLSKIRNLTNADEFDIQIKSDGYKPKRININITLDTFLTIKLEPNSSKLILTFPEQTFNTRAIVQIPDILDTMFVIQKPNYTFDLPKINAFKQGKVLIEKCSPFTFTINLNNDINNITVTTTKVNTLLFVQTNNKFLYKLLGGVALTGNFSNTKVKLKLGANKILPQQGDIILQGTKLAAILGIRYKIEPNNIQYFWDDNIINVNFYVWNIIKFVPHDTLNIYFKKQIYNSLTLNFKNERRVFDLLKKMKLISDGGKTFEIDFEKTLKSKKIISDTVYYYLYPKQQFKLNFYLVTLDTVEEVNLKDYKVITSESLPYKLQINFSSNSQVLVKFFDDKFPVLIPSYYKTNAKEQQYITLSLIYYYLKKLQRGYIILDTLTFYLDNFEYIKKDTAFFNKNFETYSLALGLNFLLRWIKTGDDKYIEPIKILIYGFYNSFVNPLNIDYNRQTSKEILNVFLYILKNKPVIYDPKDLDSLFFRYKEYFIACDHRQLDIDELNNLDSQLVKYKVFSDQPVYKFLKAVSLYQHTLSDNPNAKWELIDQLNGLEGLFDQKTINSYKQILEGTGCKKYFSDTDIRIMFKNFGGDPQSLEIQVNDNNGVIEMSLSVNKYHKLGNIVLNEEKTNFRAYKELIRHLQKNGYILEEEVVIGSADAIGIKPKGIRTPAHLEKFVGYNFSILHIHFFGQIGSTQEIIEQSKTSAKEMSIFYPKIIHTNLILAFARTLEVRPFLPETQNFKTIVITNELRGRDLRFVRIYVKLKPKFERKAILIPNTKCLSKL